MPWRRRLAGYAHIGAIRALTEAGIKIDIINGTSIGAIIGGMYALYLDVDTMTVLVKKVVESMRINHFNLFRHSTEGAGIPAELVDGSGLWTLLL